MIQKKRQHEDTTTKINADIETALRKATDAGPYPKEAPKSRPSRSAPRTRSPARRSAPKAD